MCTPRSISSRTLIIKKLLLRQVYKIASTFDEPWNHISSYKVFMLLRLKAYHQVVRLCHSFLFLNKNVKVHIFWVSLNRQNGRKKKKKIPIQNRCIPNFMFSYLSLWIRQFSTLIRYGVVYWGCIIISKGILSPQGERLYGGTTVYQLLPPGLNLQK